MPSHEGEKDCSRIGEQFFNRINHDRKSQKIIGVDIEEDLA